LRILVDHREHSDFKDLVKQVFPEADVTQLPFGDLVFVLDKQVMVVERKTIQDFVTSVRDNRLWEQLLRLMSRKTFDGVNIKRRILLICGTVNEYLEGIKGISTQNTDTLLRSIMGAQLEVVFVYDTPIIFAETKNETEAFLRTVAKREAQGKNDKNPKSRWYRSRSPSKLPMKDLKVFTLSSVPSIGEKLARVMVDHFENIANVANATIDDLIALPGIGPKKAQKIFDTLH
jgi:Fanconi anemia group M protein